MAYLSRELPMPTINKITSLGQAHATLSHCWNKLWNYENQQGDRESLSYERRRLQDWLQTWERAFTHFLSPGMAGMSSEDLTQCRVLKANHLACTIMASDTLSNASTNDSDVFDAEFQAIVELAGAVLKARERICTPSSASTASPVDPPAAIAGLDVRAPLWIVLARCSNAVTWDRANRLSLQSHGQ